ncbi:hypothetical protein BU23DRAFT_566507 [Bimuria novae-zelandiae CBS 107.79]|uniref:Uncharacterized protein n=1 Tax=Bimuria novae-zelandiae CBS 107.79 TaxID=1447943 RepID=A0A6A5VFB0_9PLEO|nr:hypothetical protein BU23DRAFT_566507 [Bimuria novae-zelandiae CBS 107.79]
MTGNIVNIREDEDETRVDAATMKKVVVVTKLNTAHKNAITDIAVDEQNFDYYLETAGEFQTYRFRNMFPGLQHLHLYTRRVNMIPQGWFYEMDKSFWDHKPKRLEEGKQKIGNRLEKGAVQLVWHENSIEDYEMWITDDESHSSPSADESSDVNDSEEDSGLKWTIHTEEDSGGKDEIDYQVDGDNEKLGNSENEDSDDDSESLDYDSEILDI